MLSTTTMRTITRLSNIRMFSTRKFYEVPYDDQWESRDFYRPKLRKKDLTLDGKISETLKQILMKENPNDFGFLGYSNVKYTCKTEEEIKWEKDNPLG